MAKVKIDGDLFEISKRLKNIDRGYYAEFDTETNKYLIKHSSEKDYFMVLPYEALDARAIKFVLMSMTDKLDFFNIQKQNEELEKSHQNELSYKAKYMLKEKLAFAEGKGDIDFN